MFKKASIVLFALAMAAVVVLDPFGVRSSLHFSGGKAVKIELSRGPFTLFQFPTRKPRPRALIVFGSGDGGWGDFEESICRAWQGEGYEVIGIDFAAYAATGYNLAILQADYDRIIRTVLVPFAQHPPPVIVAGYSMGAAQTVAAAGGPQPPPGLIGLVLIDPLSRGRYGLRESDRLNVLPSGSDTFAVQAFAGGLRSTRVVQWHAQYDDIDSSAWLDSLACPHELFTFPQVGHDYAIHRDEFIRQLLQSTQWVAAANHRSTPPPATAHP